MIYSLLKWYAIARGIYRWHRRRPQTLAEFDVVFKERYIGPIRHELANSRILLFDQ